MIQRYLAALIVLVVTAVASASTSHVDFCRAAIGRLPIASVDKSVDFATKAAQLEAIAQAVAAESRTPPTGITPRQWAALLLTIGFHESTFSLAVHRGECAHWQCDAHKLKGGGVQYMARSPWQLHENDHTRPVWDQLVGVENTAVQVAAASKMAKVSYYRCSRLRLPMVLATVRGFGGGSCTMPMRGEDARLATFGRLSR